LNKAPQDQRVGVELGSKERSSTTVDREGDIAKPVLEGPAGSEVKANTAGGMANASADFEELSAQGFNLCGAPGQRNCKRKKLTRL